MPHRRRLTVQEKPMSNRVNPVSHWVVVGGGQIPSLKGTFLHNFVIERGSSTNFGMFS